MDRPAAIINDVASKTLTIRSMREQGEDIRTYCVLFQRIFAQPPWNEAWTLDRIDGEIKKIMRKKGFTGMVAEYEAAPAGYLTGYRLQILPFIPSLYYLDQLFVDDRHRGIGIGKSLLSNMLRLDCIRGDRCIVLLTRANSPAEQFYLGNGFRRFSSMIRFKGKVLLYKLLR